MIEAFHVVQGTTFSSTDLFASANNFLCWQAYPFIQAEWQIQKFAEKGVTVKGVWLENINVVEKFANDKVAYKHWAFEYDLKVDASPVSPLIVLAIALGIVIVAISIAYVNVTSGGNLNLGLMLLAGLAIFMFFGGIGAFKGKKS